MPRRLSFLICGSQKAGTSALHRYLSQHPQLFLPKEKELHFFDNESLSWPKPDFGELHSYFRDALPNQLLGEATPITMYWDPAPERVWQYNPEMKLIVMLRDPVSRAYSHWAMESARNCESMPFRDAIALEEQRASATRPLQDRVHSYIDRGFYSHQIRRLWRLFGKNNVLILMQNYLQKNPQQCLEEICRHLNVSPMPTVKPLKERVGIYGEMMDDDVRCFLQQTFRSEISQLEQMLNWDCSNWLETWK